MFPPKGSTDAHGNEVQIGTNCLGPRLLYKLLEPTLITTAASSPKGTVRVTWAGSMALDVMSPRPDGMELADDGRPNDKGVQHNYGQSKVGNLFLAREFARSTPQTGITHACFNPGNLRTELQRHWEGLGTKLTVSTLSWHLCPAACLLASITNFGVKKEYVPALPSHQWRIHRALGCPVTGLDP